MNVVKYYYVRFLFILTGLGLSKTRHIHTCGGYVRYDHHPYTSTYPSSVTGGLRTSDLAGRLLSVFRAWYRCLFLHDLAEGLVRSGGSDYPLESEVPIQFLTIHSFPSFSVRSTFLVRSSSVLCLSYLQILCKLILLVISYKIFNNFSVSRFGDK